MFQEVSPSITRRLVEDNAVRIAPIARDDGLQAERTPRDARRSLPSPAARPTARPLRHSASRWPRISTASSSRPCRANATALSSGGWGRRSRRATDPRPTWRSSRATRCACCAQGGRQHPDRRYVTATALASATAARHRAAPVGTRWERIASSRGSPCLSCHFENSAPR
jgi:hypothetical protein